MAIKKIKIYKNGRLLSDKEFYRQFNEAIQKGDAIFIPNPPKKRKLGLKIEYYRTPKELSKE